VLERFPSYFTQFAVGEQHLWPRQVKWVFVAIFLAYLTFLFQGLPSDRSSKVARTVSLIVVLTAFLLAPWILGLVRTADGYRYTALVGLLPVYPAVFAQTMSLARRTALRFAILLAASWIIFSFVFFQNVAAVATYTTNQRDLAVATRMLARLESHPDFPAFSSYERQSVLLIGRLSYRSKDVPFQHQAPDPMSTSIVNCGVFNCQPGRFRHLMRFVDYPSKRFYDSFELQHLDDLPDRSAIASSILAASTWPGPDSVLISGDRAFIVLQLSGGLRRGLRSIARGP
jgi:hypothetical protein